MISPQPETKTCRIVFSQGGDGFVTAASCSQACLTCLLIGWLIVMEKGPELQCKSYAHYASLTIPLSPSCALQKNTQVLGQDNGFVGKMLAVQAQGPEFYSSLST